MTEESLNNFINIAIIFKTQQTHGVSIQRRRQQSEKSLQVPIFRQERKRIKKKNYRNETDSWDAKQKKEI